MLLSRNVIEPPFPSRPLQPTYFPNDPQQKEFTMNEQTLNDATMKEAIHLPVDNNGKFISQRQTAYCPAERQLEEDCCTG